MPVHDHGAEEGAGLSCNELRLSDGTIKGECLLTVQDVYGNFTRQQKDLTRFLVNASILASSYIDVTPVLAARPDYKATWRAFKDYERNVVRMFMNEALKSKRGTS